MPFPPSDREKYSNDPLDEVICQLKFPAILSIGEKAPSKFQDEIRKDYPIYERHSPGLNLPAELAPLSDFFKGQLPIEPVHEFKFSSADNNWFVNLGIDFIALSTKKYGQWETFRDRLTKVMQALLKIYEPPFFTRIGLRYIDTIDRERLSLADTPWQDLLVPHISGYFNVPNIGDKVHETQSITRIELDEPDEFVRIRYGTAIHRPSQRQVFRIDSDFYTEQRVDKDDYERVLERFHSHSGNLFRSTITARLQQALGPGPV